MMAAKEINPSSVTDAAAQLFWRLVENIGFNNTQDAVLKTSGKCLFDKQFAKNVLNQYGVYDIDYEERKRFFIAIADEALHAVTNEINLNGIIYSEDCAAGRSPSAQNLVTSGLNPPPKIINISGPIPPITGRLCLRHPLPAVVFSQTLPESQFIKIKDTTTALGFDYPLFFSARGANKMPDGLFALTGIFHIPTRDESSGNKWNSLIQNSTRFTEGCDIYTSTGTTKIIASW